MANRIWNVRLAIFHFMSPRKIILEIPCAYCGGIYYVSEYNFKNGRRCHQSCAQLYRSSLGFKPSIIARNRMSKSRTGRRQTKETKTRRSLAMLGKLKGRKLTDEHRNKIIKSLIGRKKSEETKIKISKSNLGKRKPKLSEEHKRRLSDVNLGKAGPHPKPIKNLTTGETFLSVSAVDKSSGQRCKLRKCIRQGNRFKGCVWCYL